MDVTRINCHLFLYSLDGFFVETRDCKVLFSFCMGRMRDQYKIENEPGFCVVCGAGIKPRASCLLGKRSAAELHPQPQFLGLEASTDSNLGSFL